MSEWQPIETAPKDGTWLLACRCDGLLRGCVVISWSDQADEDFNWNDGEYTFSPTHWMPLPDPPVSPVTPQERTE